MPLFVLNQDKKILENWPKSSPRLWKISPKAQSPFLFLSRQSHSLIYYLHYCKQKISFSIQILCSKLQRSGLKLIQHRSRSDCYLDSLLHDGQGWVKPTNVHPGTLHKRPWPQLQGADLRSSRRAVNQGNVVEGATVRLGRHSAAVEACVGVGGAVAVDVRRVVAVAKSALCEKIFCLAGSIPQKVPHSKMYFCKWFDPKKSKQKTPTNDW